MLTNDLMLDALGRINEIVHKTVYGLTTDEVVYRPDKSANSIAWLIWHLTRIQDMYIADFSDGEEAWSKTWSKRFALPFDDSASGYGFSEEDVAAVRANSDLLLGYFDATYKLTVKYVKGLSESDYKRVVDKRWDPPVTLGVRLISIISEGLQHGGQAAYVRGLIK